MKIIVGFDDQNETTAAVVQELRDRGHNLLVLEQGAWPDIARQVAEAVVSKEADQGVLFCWTGTGTAMAANKIAGARAALVWDPWIAEGARRWNNANILVMSLKKISPEKARKILGAWFSVKAPDPDELKNIAKIAEIEKEGSK